MRSNPELNGSNYSNKMDLATFKRLS